jgi:hypothetical protein
VCARLAAPGGFELYHEPDGLKGGKPDAQPKDSLRRKQKGVYGSYILGEPGRQIKIILLDEFYHAQEPGPQNDLLGEEQWTWLADELKSSQDKVVVLGSSIQLLPSEQKPAGRN